MNGRYPPRLSAALDCGAREPAKPDCGARALLLGGVNGRNPPRFADCDGPACWVREPAKPDSGERVFEFGGVNGRYPPCEPALEFGMALERLAEFGLPNDPRFALEPAEARAVVLRLPKLFVSRLAGMPALGRAIEFLLRAANSVFERPPAGIAPTWFRCIVCLRLAVCCWNETGRAMLLCVPKKCWEPPLRIVDGAAARPLAERLACVGTTGRLPAIMCAPLICWRVAAIALTLPAPNCPACTVDMARRM